MKALDDIIGVAIHDPVVDGVGFLFDLSGLCGPGSHIYKSVLGKVAQHHGSITLYAKVSFSKPVIAAKSAAGHKGNGGLIYLLAFLQQLLPNKTIFDNGLTYFFPAI
jgi:hypothetical protein